MPSTPIDESPNGISPRRRPLSRNNSITPTHSDNEDEFNYLDPAVGQSLTNGSDSGSCTSTPSRFRSRSDSPPLIDERSPLIGTAINGDSPSLESCSSVDELPTENNLTHVTRLMARMIYRNKPVLCIYSFVATLIPDIQAIFAYFVFTGFVDCSKGQPHKEDEYYLMYYILLFVCFLLTIPNVIWERFRKVGKGVNYVGTGTVKPLYGSSPKWLKKLNQHLSVISMGVTGWNMASMFSSGFPKDNASFECVKLGWSEMATVKSACIGIGGVASAVLLAAPQMATYYGRAKPVYGKTMTAMTYTVFKIAMSLYPLVREMVKNNQTFNPEEHVFKFIAILFMTLNRFRMYYVTNEVISFTYDIKTDNYYKKQKSKFLTGDETAELEQLRKAACNVLVNAKINDMHIAYLKQRGTIWQLYDSLVPIIGSASVAYITVLSLEAIAKAMGLYYSSVWQTIAYWIASIIYANAQMFKFCLGAIRTKAASSTEFTAQFETMLANYNEQKANSAQTKGDTHLPLSPNDTSIADTVSLM